MGRGYRGGLVHTLEEEYGVVVDLEALQVREGGGERKWGCTWEA